MKTLVVTGFGAVLGGILVIVLTFQILGNGDDSNAATDVAPTQATEESTDQSSDPPPDNAAEPGISAEPETDPVIDKVPSVSATTTDMVTDPTGDLERSFSDLDPIDAERSVDGISGQDVMNAADVTAMQVVSSAEDQDTRITLTFNGAAQDIRSEESGTLQSRSIGGDVVISPPNGRVLNVLFRDDGKIKISDIPPGMSITSEWLTPDELLIVIAGLVLNPATQVEAFVLIGAYGGFMTDVVSLITSGT